MHEFRVILLLAALAAPSLAQAGDGKPGTTDTKAEYQVVPHNTKSGDPPIGTKIIGTTVLPNSACEGSKPPDCPEGCVAFGSECKGAGSLFNTAPKGLAEPPKQ